MSMILNPFVTSDFLIVIPSTKSLPTKTYRTIHDFNAQQQTPIEKFCNYEKLNLESGKPRKKEPLEMSFWPRGRTLVRGWRRDLSSLMVESGDMRIEMISRELDVDRCGWVAIAGRGSTLHFLLSWSVGLPSSLQSFSILTLASLTLALRMKDLYEWERFMGFDLGFLIEGLIENLGF
uniref:Uncharacterized protein n=1 Tax=Cannabis sativa TaxID=3483 RepID=A0A803P0T5_CANSA